MKKSKASQIESGSPAVALGAETGSSERRVTLSSLPLLSWQGNTPDCGPHALAMASSCTTALGPTPARCAELLRYFRLPGVGATLPMGLAFVAGRLGLRVRAGVLGTVANLRSAVDAGHPVVVLVHHGDLAPFWAELHFRVVVGYDVDASDRVTQVLLACSATPHNAERGWNLSQPVSLFYGQWHNYALPRWYAEVWAS